MMKAMIAGAAALAMLTGAVMNTETENKEIPGGWTESDEPEMTEELKEIFEIATEDLIDVTYTDKDGNALMQIRKAAGEDDISGDYNEYVKEKTIRLSDGTKVTLRGDKENAWSVAVWTKNTEDEESAYSFAICSGEKTFISDQIKKMAEVMMQS
jgi:ABC-type glycerol-3-phosphate transport system substrate-binding protein